MKKGAWGGVCGLENVRILCILSAHTYTHEHVSTDKHNIFPEAMQAIRSVYEEIPNCSGRYMNEKKNYNPWPCKVGFAAQCYCFWGGAYLISHTNRLRNKRTAPKHFRGDLKT